MIGVMLFLLVVGFLAYLLFRKPTNQVSVAGVTVTKAAPEIKVEFPPRLGWVVAVIVAGLNLFSYDSNYGVGTALFTLCTVGAMWLLFPAKKRSVAVWGLGALAILASAGIAWWANGFIQSLNAVVTVLALVLLLTLYCVDSMEWQGLWLLKHVLLFIPRSIVQALAVVKHSFQPKVAQQWSLVSIVKTSFIALVVAGFFVGLLTQADPVFAQVIERVWEQAWGRVLASLLLTFVVVTLTTIMYKDAKASTTKLSWLSYHDLMVSLAVVVALFAVFIMVQVQYLFGGSYDNAVQYDKLVQYGLTYAEYVRKGFTELLLVSFFGGLMVYIVAHKRRILENRTHQNVLAVLLTLFAIELAMVMFSALKRDLMYVEVYGLTRVRLIGGVFLAWLSINLVVMMTTLVWKQMKEVWFLSGLLLSSILVVIALNGMHMDRMIAQAAPPTGQVKDYLYITLLSEDAKDSWEPAVRSAADTFNALRGLSELNDGQKDALAKAKLSLIALHEKKVTLINKYGSKEEVLKVMDQEEERDSSFFDRYTNYGNDVSDDELPKSLDRQRSWQSTVFSERGGYEFVHANPALFDEVTSLLKQIEEYQVVNKVDLYDQERRFLFEYEYPFVDASLRYYPKTLTRDPEFFRSF